GFLVPVVFARRVHDPVRLDVGEGEGTDPGCFLGQVRTVLDRPVRNHHARGAGQEAGKCTHTVLVARAHVVGVDGRDGGSGQVTCVGASFDFLGAFDVGDHGVGGEGGLVGEGQFLAQGHVQVGAVVVLVGLPLRGEQGLDAFVGGQ